MTRNIRRCPWVNLKNDLYVSYHDDEWGRPVHADNLHFEMLTLEGAQAGLSWEIVLKKRDHYRKVFKNFDPETVACYTARHVEELMHDPGIVRNRLKIESTITNAMAFLAVRKEFGTFDRYIWNFIGNKPVKTRFRNADDYPVSSVISDIISRDLKKRGFKFVGSTIIYAYMQAIGMTQDHVLTCSFRK
ncbi:MAG: DNA-3-methyladenine glycosylase I [Candidatus Omnitrophota bacterium]